MKKKLFYEDIEEVTFEETQKLVEFYEYLEVEESNFYLEYRDSVENNFRKDISESGPIIHCSKVILQEWTLEDFTELLRTQGYELKHKIGTDQTEQLRARLFKTIDRRGDRVGYCLLDLAYSIWYTPR